VSAWKFDLARDEIKGSKLVTIVIESEELLSLGLKVNEWLVSGIWKRPHRNMV
jgi:hypothetical protein